MIIVNNFKLIKSHLNFNSDDEFYYVQIFVRGKDGHNINGSNTNRLVKFYIIKSKEDLDKYETEIKNLCRLFNARAYIHFTKRSIKEVANQVLLDTVNTYISNPEGLKSIYSSACGKSYLKSDKTFLVDIDEVKEYSELKEYIDFINKECDPKNEEKLISIVPTVHGFHLITKPFNTKTFTDKYPTIDIHKNNPTLLYFECLTE